MEPIPPQENLQDKPQPSREERFVQGVIKRCTNNKGVAARLRRADNPATEYQSWELLVAYGVDLEKDYERLRFTAIAAAIAKAKCTENGTLRLGSAIAACFADKQRKDQGSSHLRRLLACDGLPELCRVLRPLFSLIDSRVKQQLDYVRLLEQLRRFNFNAQKVKAQWAQEFYSSITWEDA